MIKAKAKRTNQLLCEHLRLTRKNKNTSLQQLADLLGSNQSTISKIELNSRRLDIAEFVYYCRALGKDPVKELRTIASY